MKNTFKRLAGFYADLAQAFMVLMNNLSSAAFPPPATQQVPVRVDQPRAIR